MDFIDEEIKQVFFQNAHFTQIGVVDEIMKTIHQSSPSYSQTMQIMGQLLENYQLNVEVVKFKCLSKDESYVYARAQQKVTKVSGPEFKENITDQLLIFKKDGDDWKIWTTAILSIKYLD